MWQKMRLLWVVVLLLGQLAGYVSAWGGPGGGECTLSLGAAVKPKTAKPGQTLKLVMRLVNGGKAGFADGVLQLQLSPRTSFKSASAPRRWAKGQKPTYDAATNTVTWAHLNIPTKSAQRFSVKFKVKCYPGPELRFAAAAYVLDPTADEPVPMCLQEKAIVVVSGLVHVVGKEARWDRRLVGCLDVRLPSTHRSVHPHCHHSPSSALVARRTVGRRLRR